MDVLGARMQAGADGAVRGKRFVFSEFAPSDAGVKRPSDAGVKWSWDEFYIKNFNFLIGWNASA